VRLTSAMSPLVSEICLTFAPGFVVYCLFDFSDFLTGVTHKLLSPRGVRLQGWLPHEDDLRTDDTLVSGALPLLAVTTLIPVEAVGFSVPRALRRSSFFVLQPLVPRMCLLPIPADLHIQHSGASNVSAA
jgi:hypothetical protein